jgi:hypothetical protein
MTWIVPVHPISERGLALLLNLIVPRINDYMTTAIVEDVYADEGAVLGVGAKLLDITVDLSAAAPHDCPPISHYRLVLREPARLRSVLVKRGDEPAVGAPLALFTTEPDEPLDAGAGRPLRVAIAAILRQSAWETD